jgi:putative membrane protein
MPPLSSIPVFLVATEHIYIMVLESFLWTSPRGRKAFRTTPAFAESTKVLAANQGLYNGFLAAGLYWGLFHPVRDFGKQIQLFFLGCVLAAGAVGGATANKKIFFIQGMPGMVGLAAILLS